MREALNVELKELLLQAARGSPNGDVRKKHHHAHDERAKPHDSGELDDGVLGLEQLGEWPHPSVVRNR